MVCGGPSNGVSRPLTCPQVMNAVCLVQVSETVAELQWSSSAGTDMIADSALALLLGIDSSPATVKCEHPYLSTTSRP